MSKSEYESYLEKIPYDAMGDFSVPTFFATQSAPFRRDRLCGFYCVKKARSVSHT